MDTKNSEFVIKDNKLYEYLGNGKKMLIPEGVESIEINDFEKSILGIKNFKKVVIPGTLKEIPDCFLREKTIDELIVKEGVERIGWSSFHSTFIKTLELPSTIKEIDSYAFNNCALKEVLLNPTIERLGNYCFAENRFSRFIYPKSLRCLDLNSIFPTISCQDKIELIFDFDFLYNVSYFPSEITATSIELSIIVSKKFGFSLKLMEEFFEKIKKNGYYHMIEKITLIGYHNPLNLAHLKRITKHIGMNIEIEMIKKMDEDLLAKVIGGKKHPKEEKQVLQSTSIDTEKEEDKDKEVYNLVQEIKEKSHILEDSLREKVILQVENLIKKYQRGLKELKPKLESENEISLGFYQTPQSLRLGLIRALQEMNLNFINLDADIYLKKKIEKYRELAEDNNKVELEEEVDSVEDKIQAIKYYASLLSQINIKDELLKILTEIENHLLIPSLDTVTLSMNRSSINYEQELEHRIDCLYQKVKETNQFYQSLCGENDTSLGNDMRLLNEILNSLDQRNKMYYQDRLSQIKNKYLEEIKELRIEKDSVLKVREELIPILEDLKELIPNLKGKKEILDDISEARGIMIGEDKKDIDAIISRYRDLLIQLKTNNPDEIDLNKVNSEIKRIDAIFHNPDYIDEHPSVPRIDEAILSLLESSTLDESIKEQVEDSLDDIDNDYDRRERMHYSTDVKRKVGAITSTTSDIMLLLENNPLEEEEQKQIKDSLLYILDDAYQQIMNNSFIIEERKDSITKNLNWSSRATLQILSKFHEIQNFIDETIKYNEEIESFNSSHGKGA